MAKALDFTDPDRMSMTVILTAMNRFINEADGSQTAVSYTHLTLPTILRV